MSNARAVRYRRLALAEQDNEKARLLQLIADEAERGVLFTVDRVVHNIKDETVTDGKVP
jgi:hypothetical protein